VKTKNVFVVLRRDYLTLSQTATTASSTGGGSGRRRRATPWDEPLSASSTWKPGVEKEDDKKGKKK
jgi:hypothetical protein